MKPAARRQLGICLLFLAFAFVGCEKDDKECPTNGAPPDGRDQFVGQYKVYDTTGVYLYDMEIMKANDAGKDSLFVVNWGGEFDFWVFHDNGDASGFLNIIPPFPSYDGEGHRWAFFQDDDALFNSNMMVNDTLRLSYELNNIAFYVEDEVPFHAWGYREYGVKE